MTRPSSVVFVTGGRGYGGRAHVFKTLDTLRPRPTLVVHGMCCNREGELTGADRWANEWACVNGIPVHGYPADWSRGLKAGPERSRHAINAERPDVVIAFPGGNGTQAALNHAVACNIPVWDERAP